MSESFASMDDRGVPEISAEEEAALTAALSPERLAEIRSLLRYETSISFHSARAKESMLLLVAEVDRLRGIEANARKLIGQWNEAAETWAPLSSPENNRENFGHFRALCSAYCEAADGLHNVLAGFNPDVPWHRRNTAAPTTDHASEAS